jgi:hypothetical protein
VPAAFGSVAKGVTGARHVQLAHAGRRGEAPDHRDGPVLCVGTTVASPAGRHESEAMNEIRTLAAILFAEAAASTRGPTDEMHHFGSFAPGGERA